MNGCVDLTRLHSLDLVDQRLSQLVHADLTQPLEELKSSSQTFIRYNPDQFESLLTEITEHYSMLRGEWDSLVLNQQYLDNELVHLAKLLGQAAGVRACPSGKFVKEAVHFFEARKAVNPRVMVKICQLLLACHKQAEFNVHG